MGLHWSAVPAGGSRGRLIPTAQRKGDSTALGQRPGFESDALGVSLGSFDPGQIS